MRNTRSFADFITDWERLLDAVENNETNLPDLSLQRGTLDHILEEAKAVGTRQEASRSQSAIDAKRRRELIFEGRAAASQLRARHQGIHRRPQREAARVRGPSHPPAPHRQTRRSSAGRGVAHRLCSLTTESIGTGLNRGPSPVFQAACQAIPRRPPATTGTETAASARARAVLRSAARRPSGTNSSRRRPGRRAG
jgi:hypothetical protein